MYYVENNRIRKLVNGVSSTLANSAGTTGFSGDNGPALAAQFFFYSSPSNKLALASNGDLYIADGYNNRVRKIDAQTGIITTIAGTGAAGISGDGGLATNATLSLPHVLSLDGAGHLYVGDSFGVRRITLSTNIIDLIANNIQGVYLDGGPWAISVCRSIPACSLINRATFSFPLVLASSGLVGTTVTSPRSPVMVPSASPEMAALPPQQPSILSASPSTVTKISISAMVPAASGPPKPPPVSSPSVPPLFTPTAQAVPAQSQ